MMINLRVMTTRIPALASTLAALTLASAAFAAMPTQPDGAPQGQQRERRLSSRANCNFGSIDIDQDVNNVRARLQTSGDVWWNGSAGRYVVPKVAAGETEVSSLFAGAVWLGGFDPADNLKMAAQLYGRSQGNFDFYPGPLDPESGEVDAQTCSNWDRFFVVTASEIREHQRRFAAMLAGEEDYTDDQIPLGVKGWPARGNPYFEEVHGFPPPNTNQGLAGFYDYCDDEGNCNIDGLYDPLQGDLPIIEIEGCEDFYNQDEDQRDDPQFPDQMIFWIYNDNGNTHENSGSPLALEMEVQVQAFAYSTNDALNNMTFQRYKLINRGKDLLQNTFFGIWIDGDLGCYTDDFIGCDTTRSLAIYYNQDPVDGSTGPVCEGGVPTYGNDVPIMGIDYFRGPKEFIEVNVYDSTSMDSILVEVERELGMSSFTYFNNASIGSPPSQTTDPSTGIPQEFYNLLSGFWKDGTPYTFGGIGYQTPGAATKFAFPSPPAETGPEVWSMCSEGLGEGDRRTIQASGPFDLRSGAVNELIIGVPWVPDEETYPCPDLTRLLAADDLAQNLFDECFNITDGPDAPDMDIIELDRRLTLVLTNDERVSNNAFQAYAEPDLLAPEDAGDSLYRFEGYKVYQLRNANVSIADLDDPTQARLISQSDIRNGVGELYNWNVLTNPLDPTAPVFEPVAQIESPTVDRGVETVIRVFEDQFASGADTRLINHKPYYFTVVSYAYNNYEDFNPRDNTGQKLPYLEGRNNIMTYVGVPRPITDTRLGDDNKGATVRRLDGVGTGGFFLDFASSEERERLVRDESGEYMPLYAEGRSPVVARSYNPFVATDGTYRIVFVDDDMSVTDCSERPFTFAELEEDGEWLMIDGNQDTILRGQSYAALNEQVIGELGISVTLGQVPEPGTIADASNGCTGYEVNVLSDGEGWFEPIRNKFAPTLAPEVFNFMRTSTAEAALEGSNTELDPDQGLTNCFDQSWVPFKLATTRNPNAQLGFLTPAYLDGGSRLPNALDLEDLNNVDVVFTDDKSLWSRCVIVESAVSAFTVVAGVDTEGDAGQFDLRDSPSVSKEDADGDGLPDPDGAVDDGGAPIRGMGWFPGYAIDVETGARLNIFFGENSAIRADDDIFNPYNLYVAQNPEFVAELTGRDMMFNPGSVAVQPEPGATEPALYYAIAGGHHWIYVTREPYDECEQLYSLLSQNSRSRKRDALELVTYASLPLSARPFKSYANGLIPEPTVVKLRVTNPYQAAEAFCDTNDDGEDDDRYWEFPTYENNQHPAYELTLEGVTSEALAASTYGDSILSFVNVVPNPYYGYSPYEISEFSNIIRVTNLPARATITIYTLDGKFIRQYRRAEEPLEPTTNPEDPRLNNRGVANRQIYPDLDWDMKNDQGIPVASGVYLIHVNAPDLGERTLKSFIIQREFDPAGL